MIRYILFLVLVIAIISSLAYLSRMSGKQDAFSYELFETCGGWGYDILINDKIFIHQETVPAVDKNIEFPSRQAAAQTAELIITKLKEKKLPAISMFEMNGILSGKDQ